MREVCDIHLGTYTKGIKMELKDMGKTFEPVRKHRWASDFALVEAGAIVFIAGPAASVRASAGSWFARRKIPVTIRAGSQDGVIGCMIHLRDMPDKPQMTRETSAPPEDDGL